MQTETMNLFAIPVTRSTLGRGYTSEELEYIRAQLQQPVGSISNFSSRNKNVLAAPEMQSIAAALQESINQHFKIVFNTSNKVSLKVTQSWLTLTRKGESHHSHVHPNSVLSGALYINTANEDGINFYREQRASWFELLREQETYHNAYRYFIPVSIGDILLFPSDLHHGVREVVDDIERVSLSFNTFFDGELGRDEFANALRISVQP